MLPEPVLKVQKNVKRGAFLCEGRTLRGLHDFLSQTFYPTYDFKRANFGPVGPSPPVNQRAKTSEEGKRIGTLVDSQLRCITQMLGRHRDLGLSVFIQPRLAVPARLRQDQTLQRLRNNLHLHTRRVVTGLHMLKLRPIASQLPVGHEILRVGTALDLLCIDIERHLVVVEIKSGFDTYYERHTLDRMRPPFQDKNDSPHNQHQLQLALSLLLFCRTYNLPTSQVKGCVLRTFHRGVVHYPLESWARERLVAMQLALVGATNRELEAKERQKEEELTNHTRKSTAGTFIAINLQPRPARVAIAEQQTRKRKRTPPHGVLLSRIQAKKKKRPRAAMKATTASK